MPLVNGFYDFSPGQLAQALFDSYIKFHVYLLLICIKNLLSGIITSAILQLDVSRLSLKYDICFFSFLFSFFKLSSICIFTCTIVEHLENTKVNICQKSELILSE